MTHKRRGCIRYVKDTILKAIYNVYFRWSINRVAVFDMSKIQFWKQFTTIYLEAIDFIKLYSICQRYNFESNLQLQIPYPDKRTAVFDMSKIQFWKQFTTLLFAFRSKSTLYSICQRYNFESNLQQPMWFCTLKFRCIRYVKDTILKAIYNTSLAIYLNKEAVFDMSKIQFWKQFTTRLIL